MLLSKERACHVVTTDMYGNISAETALRVNSPAIRAANALLGLFSATFSATLDQQPAFPVAYKRVLQQKFVISGDK